MDRQIDPVDIICHMMRLLDWNTPKAIIDNDEQFGYHPLCPWEFYEVFKQVLRYCPKKKAHFLDAGCGIGTKVLLAQAMGCKAVGIEYIDEYVAHANQIMGKPKAYSPDIRKDDVLTHNYASYDIIYFYRPFKCNRLQNQFENQIACTAKIDAVIMNGLGNFHSIFNAKQFEPLDVKCSSQMPALSVIRKVAEPSEEELKSTAKLCGI